MRSTGSHSEVWPKIGGKLRPGSLSYDRSTFSVGPWDGIKMTAPEYVDLDGHFKDVSDGLRD